MSIDDTLSAVQARLKLFDATPRYVIHGKTGTEYAGLAYGLGMVDETSNLVYLYEEHWQVEDAFNQFAESFKRNSKKDANDFFEICEVKREELHTTFKRAHII